jgi:inhibitor of KinA
LAFYFDPLVATFDGLSVEVRRLADASAETNAPAPAVIEVPVWYGGPFGPDLADIAHFADASEEEVVRLHVERLYRVYMLGFMPGHAYLASVDPRIAMPRHETPRLRVPSGSVGIAKFQTGFSAVDIPTDGD